ncbi:hypothetical protein [Mycobacterium aquaticum]|uniref:Uncharacterized protein n=1 Tax=Mycobacterium aquaticum TaxID=1927124 RepID=A0A1X0AH38_9MYCO|nr:hypothetical protein [Mycobacterium aquaticum]ORA29321.1 hypothetical protein BST13_27465 [Mycobacterium aquaticum]
MGVWNSQNPNQVVSMGTIEADLGVANRWLLVMSGIVLLEWRYDSDVVLRGEERVLLGVHARDLEQWSAYVGLASIQNSESGFLFATDWARVELDPNTGELVLIVNTALMGEWSALHRFSYQVVATVVRVGTAITGTITWPTELFRPESDDPAIAQSVLTVVANRYENVPASGGNFGYENLTPLVPGAIEHLTVSADECQASYRIPNPPMATDLRVTLNIAQAFSAQDPGASVGWGQTKGPYDFTLTPQHPTEEIDFQIRTSVVK